MKLCKIKTVYQTSTVTDALKRYAIRNYETGIEEQKSKYKSYLHDIDLRNVKIKRLNGLSCINYQLEYLTEFMRKAGSLTIIGETLIAFEDLDEHGDVKQNLQHLFEVEGMKFLMLKT